VGETLVLPAFTGGNTDPALRVSAVFFLYYLLPIFMVIRIPFIKIVDPEGISLLGRADRRNLGRRNRVSAGGYLNILN